MRLVDAKRRCFFHSVTSFGQSTEGLMSYEEGKMPGAEAGNESTTMPESQSHDSLLQHMPQHAPGTHPEGVVSEFRAQLEQMFMQQIEKVRPCPPVTPCPCLVLR